MVRTSSPCPIPTNAEKLWPYDEYYFGQKDQEKRRNGRGENHWTGAESIEWYRGHFVRDTMNGYGDYRWRYRGPGGLFVTYEGHLLANKLHGYGTMSYPDGRVFSGIYYNNIRWGPGVQSHTCLLEDVGFWRGTQLVRLAWRPSTPNVVIDLVTGNEGISYVEKYRVKLSRTSKILGETNSALELLKQCGAEPMLATDKWPKLYPKNCTDLKSAACHVDVFEKDYYRGKIHSLEEVAYITEPSEVEDVSQDSRESQEKGEDNYFAWNNNEMMLHMMKHCYKHDKQRKKVKVNLQKLLNGPRRRYRPAGKHERDCRTLLMASYLGHITNVAQLINEQNIYPDVADMKGNTALMYAACGDQGDVIHFLVEAGADINGYNDSCCTPLGVALMRFACLKNDVAPNGMVDALLPPARGGPSTTPVSDAVGMKIHEWLINRDPPMRQPITISPKSMSKTSRNPSAKRIKSLTTSLAATSNTTKKKFDIPAAPKYNADREYDSDESFSEERRLYSTIGCEFSIRVNNAFAGPNLATPYLFTANDMLREIDLEDELSKNKDKKLSKHSSKLLKEVLKSNKSLVIWQSNETAEFASLNSTDRVKIELLATVMLTIMQLLSDGADPCLVRSPQPGLLLAMASGSTDLVRHLINYGADVNETFPSMLGYTALDVAISRPLRYENIDMIRTLLNNGADTNHRLQYYDPEVPGPTLVHALFAKQTEFEFEDEILHQVLELFIRNNYNPFIQFKGQSAIDIVISKKISHFDIFIKSPKVDLNKVINSDNQTILVKMFCEEFYKSSRDLDRVPILTNLLLYGADPLMKCQDKENEYKNIFAFTKKTITDMERGKFTKDAHADKGDAKNGDKNKKLDPKDKKAKPESDKAKIVSNKSIGKVPVYDPNDYKLAVDLVMECARLLHIRWLQAKIMKDLLSTVYRYKHRPWIMIIKEHKNNISAGLWLTPQRCLEIWDILKTTRKKIYKEDRILKYLLYIVQFYNKRSNSVPFDLTMTTADKSMIETIVAKHLNEHKIAAKLSAAAEAWKGFYVKPELEVRAGYKYNICFECSLPLDDDQKIPCNTCNLVSFCSFECIQENIDRASCHPCSFYMKEKYFPSPTSSEIQIDTSILL